MKLVGYGCRSTAEQAQGGQYRGPAPRRWARRREQRWPDLRPFRTTEPSTGMDEYLADLRSQMEMPPLEDQYPPAQYQRLVEAGELRDESVDWDNSWKTTRRNDHEHRHPPRSK